MLRRSALILALGSAAGGWMPPPSFDGPLAGLPEPDLQNRRCGQGCGANDTTSAMCQGSTVDGRLLLPFVEVRARCAADTACVGFGQFTGSYFRPVTFFASLDHSHPGQWKTWRRSDYKPAPHPPPTPPPPPQPHPPPPPPPPSPSPPGPPGPACPWISGSKRPCLCPKLPCNPKGQLKPFCGVCTCVCSAFTNASCCTDGHNGVFGGCAWDQSDSKCSPKPPAPHKPMLENPCTPGYVAAKTPFCDHTLPPERRLDDAIARIPLEEKFGMLGTAGLYKAMPGGGSKTLNMTGYQWWSEATHGISHYYGAPEETHGKDTTTEYMTNFPFPITTAMSFNRSLWHAIGAQIGREARAAMNVGNAYSTFWTPVVNMARDPRWGRNLEAVGEDPTVTAEYAEFFIKGMQENPAESRFWQAGACCKHYAGNSVEGSTETGITWGRDTMSVNISQRDLHEYYLRPYQSCVERANVSGLMCSYNELNSVPSCASEWLLNTTARAEWGFKGYVTSDCDAVLDIWMYHNWSNPRHPNRTPEQATADAVMAGMDLDCGSFTYPNGKGGLDKALAANATTGLRLADIDAAIRNSLRVRMRLQHFDPPGPLQAIPLREICSNYSVQLAREAVAQSAALLKNEGNVLPLDASKINMALVMGVNTNTSTKIAAYYGPGGGKAGEPCRQQQRWSTNPQTGRPQGNYLNFMDAVASFVSNTTGGGSQPKNMPLLAAEADVILLALGTTLDMAHEGKDYGSDLNVTRADVQLVEAAVWASNGSVPIVVVFFSGVTLDIGALLKHTAVKAILHVGQPSVNALGVTDVLFGRQVPAGRTVTTMYPAEFGLGLSIFDMGMRPGPSTHARPDCPIENWGPPSCIMSDGQPRPGCPGFGCPCPEYFQEVCCSQGTCPHGNCRTRYDSNSSGYNSTRRLCPNGTNPGRTHMWYTHTQFGPPALPFGYGLSFSTFIYEPQVATGERSMAPVRAMLAETATLGRTFPDSNKLKAATPPVSHTIKVTNTGAFDADDVVLGFLKPPGAGQQGVPLQILYDFARVHISAGSSELVTLHTTARDFTQVDENGVRHARAGEYTFEFGVKETLPFGGGFAKSKLVMKTDDAVARLDGPFHVAYSSRLPNNAKSSRGNDGKCFADGHAFAAPTVDYTGGHIKDCNATNAPVVLKNGTFCFTSPAIVKTCLDAVPPGRRALHLQNGISLMGPTKWAKPWHDWQVPTSCGNWAEIDPRYTRGCTLWADQWQQVVSNRFTDWFARLKAIGGSVDVIILDFETQPWWEWSHFANDTALFTADPRWPGVRDLLNEKGKPYAANFDDVTDMKNWSSDAGDWRQWVWTDVMLSRRGRYLNATLFEPARKAFPAVKGADYDHSHRPLPGKHWAFSAGGVTKPPVCCGSHFGTHGSRSYYGWEQVSMKPELEWFSPASNNGFVPAINESARNTPFNMLLMYVRQIRGELRSAPGISMMPWVQPANSSWYSVLCHEAPCGTNMSSLAYQGAWTELMFHLGLSGIEEFLWYRAGSEWVTEGIANFTAVLKELDSVTGRAGGKSHCLDTVLEWQDSAILSGIETATGSVFRFSPRDMGAVTVVTSDPATFQIGEKTFTPVVDGTLLHLPSSRGTHGFWITTAKYASDNVCNIQRRHTSTAYDAAAS